jgi:thiosulfate/3-mercaptopyruvate sulfurtransferase
MADDPKTLVSTSWLADHLNDPDLRILDGSWYLPDMKRDGRAEYERGHIPGARFFDIDEISDTRSELPHMAPPVEKFMSRMRAMGVGDGHQVVIYDGAGMCSAARVWWLFRLMGKTDVAVLDGGYPKWIAEGRETEDLRDVTQVAAASKLGDHLILDARGAARFKGAEPEPREGLRAGHIPGSRNLHYAHLLNADGTMKSEHDLRELFHDAGVETGKPVITTCGSGVTAAVLSLGLERIGHRNHSLYDGSWTEWGQFEQLAVETG